MNKFSFLFLGFALVLLSCAGGGNAENEADLPPSKRQLNRLKTGEPATDGKGIGSVKSVVLNDPLNNDWIATGEGIYDLKCAACHKLTENRLVGPGWKGVTSRRKPEWIMNMVLNVDEMLDSDPMAKEQLKECLVRMPNQNLNEPDARSILEFMLANDQGKLK